MCCFSPGFSALLAEILAALGLPASWAARLQVSGDEQLASCFPVTDLATAAITATGIATVDLLGEGAS